jgi:hypothetical protein
MPNCIGGLRHFILSVLIVSALSSSANDGFGQRAQTNEPERMMTSIEQKMEAVERHYTSIRIEIMKLRAEADYVESAISEEMHLIQALKPEDEISREPSDAAKNENQASSVRQIPDASIRTDNVLTSSPPPSVPLPETAATASKQPEQSKPSTSSTKKQDFAFVKRRANIRDTPSLRGRIVGAAAPGARFVVLNRMADWFEIEREGSRAWISARLFDSGQPTNNRKKRSPRGAQSRSSLNEPFTFFFR